MKVLCISRGPWAKSPNEVNRPNPEYLGVYRVTNTKMVKPGDRTNDGAPITELNCGLYYQLAEMHPCSGFHNSRFITLPLDDADEIEADEQEAILI